MHNSGKINIVKMTTFKKLVLCFALAMSLLVVFSVVLSFINQSEIRNRLNENVKARIDFVTAEINSSILNAKQVQTHCLSDYNFRRLSILNDLDDVPAIISSIEQTYSQITSLGNSSTLVKNASLCLFNINRSIDLKTKFLQDISEKNRIVNSIFSRNINSNIIRYDNTLHIVHPITTGSTAPKSSIIVEVSSEKLADMFRQLLPDMDAWVAVLDKENAIIASHGDNPFKSVQALNEMSQRVMEDSEQVNVIKINGKRYRVFINPIPSLESNLLVVLPDSSLSVGTEYTIIQFAVLILLIILAVGIYIYMVHCVIIRPMRHLTSALHKLEADNLVQLDKPSSDEMQYAFDAFNQMTVRLKSTITQVYEAKITAQRSELKQLQAQINPHFLYNSFFQIYRMSKLGDLDGIEELSQKLGSYYKYITRSKQDVIPMELEFKHAMDYVDIQRIRFGKRIAVEFMPLSQSQSHLNIPRFILQPIIENAFDHGLGDVQEGGRIYVSVVTDENRRHDAIIITVEDNGTTITDEQLEALTQRVKKPTLGETTAVANIALRLSLYDGKLTVERSIYGGVAVKLHISLGCV